MTLPLRWMGGVLAALLLSGCPNAQDGIYFNSKQFTPSPDLDCIAATLASIAGPSHFARSFEAGGRELTLRGIQPPDAVHTFLHRTDVEPMEYLTFTVHPDGRTTLSHAVLCDGCGAGDYVAHRERMRRTEAALATRCAMPRLVIDGSEACSEGGCPMR